MANKESDTRMTGWKTVGLVSLALMLSACSMLKRTEEVKVPEATEQGERKVVAIQQSDTQRDITTGERRFVFCNGKDCNAVSQKSIPLKPRKTLRTSMAPVRSAASLLQSWARRTTGCPCPRAIQEGIPPSFGT